MRNLDILLTNQAVMPTTSLDSTHLFIEAPFLDNERDVARKKYHLTAKEAGLIGARAKVKELTPFHFSPRYFGRELEFIQEAMTAFRSNPS